jgi:protein involved in polysaccharide export with SLBB domain
MMRMTVKQLAGRWALWCGVLGLGLVLAGCESSSPNGDFSKMGAVGGTAGGTNSLALEPNYDQIRMGDTLVISFADLPIVTLPEEQRVKEDGTISLMQNQTFEVKGKNRGQLEREIRERYVPRYFKNMTVSVRQKQDTQFYFVGGEVKLPNRQVYISRTTVLKAIASAGDFTDFAKKSKVKLTRMDGRIYIINCKTALVDPRLDLEVFPGDTITVPRRLF